MGSSASRLALAWGLAAFAGLGLAIAGGMAGGERPPPGPATDDTAPNALRYDRDIRPLLSDRCFKCHGPDAATRRADLRLDQPGAAEGDDAVITPGKPDESELWRRINATDEDRMPPENSNKRPLSEDERALIRQWITEGARYEPHWSFVPPTRPSLPTVHDQAWCRNEIDRFVLSRLEHERINPSPEADPQTLVRRVFLDITGLPPTPEETDAYLADKSPSRYESLVDRLLTQEPYRSRAAERLATPWLDAARYADTCGIHTDDGRQIWPWRDWVLAAFRDNMPFDQFATEQLAGDLIPNATLQQKVASGFNRNHVTTDEGGAIADEYLVEYAVDRASTTSTVFLGMTMGCARCHDHKFDPISHKDFYSFYSFFNSIDEPGLYSQLPDANRAHEPFIEVPTPEQRTKLDEFAKQIAAIKEVQTKIPPEEAAEHAAFLKRFPEEIGLQWAKSEVVGVKAESAAVLTPQPDGSVLASGANPPTDVHEVLLRPEKGDHDLNLLLVEALEHKSLGQGRVGRAGNGNAVLTGVEIQTFQKDAPDKPTPHEVQWLWADVSQTNGDYHFANLLVKGAGADRGWAVGAHMQNGDRHLLLLLKDPIPADGLTQVRVRLRYDSVHAQHVFGRVKLTLGSIADASKLPTEMSHAWLVGPFTTDPTASPYATITGPETATTIDFTKNFGAGNQYWRYDPTLQDGVPVPLADGVNVTFVGRLIITPVARELPVSLGSDDGLVVYVNGKEVFRHEIERGLLPDQDKATIPLSPGPNAVVLKIVNTGGSSGYYFKSAAKSDDAYPHDLVAALLPASSRTEAGAEKIRQAWRSARSPSFRESAAQLESLERDVSQLRSKLAKTMVMKELDPPRPTYVLTRGQYDHPDKSQPVTRGIPAALGSLPAGAPANRLGLAQWIVSPQNPLTARVQVNRLWEMVFGAGLVRTSEDFGQQGEWPSHPELLDWLANDFRESGWDVRRVLRMIVTSATYRQQSTPRTDLAERDPENRLLARGTRHRLPAEQIRDQALYVSGLLAEKFGGPSVKTYQPDGIWKEGALPSSNTQVYERGKGEDLYRRSLYTYWKRAVPPPDLLAFDAPTREYCVVRRPVTGTPLQALVLWNDPAFVEASRVLAQRTLKESGDDAAKLATMFRRCSGHAPGAKELAALTKALAANRTRFAAAPDDASKLLAVGESPIPTDLEKTELASWTMVAQVTLNLYATTTQE